MNKGTNAVEVKLIEVRDAGTTIVTMWWKWELSQASNQDAWMVRRAGFYANADDPRKAQAVYDMYTMGLDLNQIGNEGCKINYNPDAWGRKHKERTLSAAHRYIEAHWSELRSGDLVDVEYILGETKQPKTTENPYSENAYAIR